MPSKSIEVVTACAYLTNIEVEWRRQDYRCLNMVKALKGKSFDNYFTVKMKNGEKRFDRSNADEFVKLLYAPMAKFLKEHFSSDVCLVPIPNSAATSCDHPDFKTLAFAREIAQAAGVGCSPSLIFKTAQTPSHVSNARNPRFIHSQLKAVQPLPKKQIVLVDDVYTTGAHAKACTWKLQESGADVIGVLAFGRTTKELQAKPLSVQVEDLIV